MNEGTVFAFLIVALAAISAFALHFRFRKRQLEHQERLAALEKGLPLPELPFSPTGHRIYLLRGLMWLLGGMALSISLLGIIATDEPSSFEDRFYRTKQLQSQGANEEQISQILDDTSKRGGPPLALSLTGLIPIAVGAAYLIFFKVEQGRQDHS